MKDPFDAYTLLRGLSDKKVPVYGPDLMEYKAIAWNPDNVEIRHEVELDKYDQKAAEEQVKLLAEARPGWGISIVSEYATTLHPK